MKINKKISKYNHSSRCGAKILYLVIHYVGAVSKAKNNATYFAGGNRNASAHFFADIKEIWQSVLESMASWHCGGGLQGSGGHAYFGKCKNSNSIGIEMCLDRPEHIADATIKNTAELVKYLMKKYNIPATRVIRHYDVTGKRCPGPYLTDAKWKALHKILTGATAATTKPTTPKLTAPTTTLKKGSSGEDVKRLQRCLNKIMGAKLVVDGDFGMATHLKFREFQKKYKLTQDGICGPKSRAKIKSLVGGK